MRRQTMENKVKNGKVSDKLKKENEKLKLENHKLRAIAFYLFKIHRVAPTGRKLNKTDVEIDMMTLETLEHVIKEECSKQIEQEYKHALTKRILQKIKKG